MLGTCLRRSILFHTHNRGGLYITNASVRLSDVGDIGMGLGCSLSLVQSNPLLTCTEGERMDGRRCMCSIVLVYIIHQSLKLLFLA